MTAPQLLNSPLLPRQYQKAILERATDSNVIACVETGSGKTLVAALLLEHMWKLEQQKPRSEGSSGSSGKISLFLVNLVPLVHQQATFLERNTSLKVGMLYGELNIDTAHKNHWDNLLNSDFNVVVCTARIALNAVMHAYLGLQDVNLIVFDEAHHAIGNNGEFQKAPCL